MELKHQNLVFTSIIKKMSWCETECKKKCAIGETECNEIILGRQRRRDGGEGEERGLRKGAERREKRQKGTELQFEEEDKEHRHLPLLVVQLPQGTEFPTRFCSKVLQHCH